MLFFRTVPIIFLLGSSWLFGVDFTKFGDICEPTATQTCPNRKNEIKALQEALNDDPNLYMYIKTDGKWSKGTKEAIVIFQEHYGIKPANGYLGDYTKKILQKVTHPNAIVKNSHSGNSKVAKKHTKVPVKNSTLEKEFVLYGDMCDNSIKGNKCPNNLIEVSNLQMLLNADPNLHVNISADGKWGRGTQKAVIAFQKFYGIHPAKGYIGLRTKRVLDRVAGAMFAQASMPVASHEPSHANKDNNRDTAPIRSWKDICQTTSADSCPNRPQDVKSLQSFLNHTLEINLKTDGKWGAGTKQAVIRFQKKNHIKPANGYVGPKTRKTMQKVSHRSGTKSSANGNIIHSLSRPVKTYADFKKYTDYPRTFKVYRNRLLLSRANGKNTRIKIDVSEQRMKLYVKNKIAMDAPCTTGSKHKLEPNTKTIRDQSTPKGTFRITEKIAQKRSSIFGDIFINGKKIYHGDRRKYRGSWKNARFVGAALHDWMRLTSSGIGIHGSKYVKRYPGSNGCIRLPFTVARTVFAKVRPGTQVHIVN